MRIRGLLSLQFPFGPWSFSPSLSGGVRILVSERRLYYMETLLPRSRHTLIRVFGMDDDDIDAAAGSVDNAPAYHVMVIPINRFNSEAP